ncbi:hypothetical protein [Novosphingobium sp. 18050]|uniref:hypothetical protein n=1 Tax=Novosphingobium sp. 18050 TaxID=2681398 RepID=UPI001356D21B|nr:hypothetical protein [Novosphingobium sp. 18050]
MISDTVKHQITIQPNPFYKMAGDLRNFDRPSTTHIHAVEGQMRLVVSSFLISVALMASAPANAVGHPSGGDAHCTVDAATSHGQAAGKGDSPMLLPEGACPPEVSGPEWNVDTWMLAMLLLGALVIGVPAARRRSVPVVFS